jgi:hypothetical protein
LLVVGEKSWAPNELDTLKLGLESLSDAIHKPADVYEALNDQRASFALKILNSSQKACDSINQMFTDLQQVHRRDLWNDARINKIGTLSNLLQSDVEDISAVLEAPELYAVRNPRNKSRAYMYLANMPSMPPVHKFPFSLFGSLAKAR